MKRIAVVLLLVAAPVVAQDVRVFPPGPAKVWGQKMPAECTPVTTWPVAYYPATAPVTEYPKGCALPWWANFARFWNWASDRPEPK